MNIRKFSGLVEFENVTSEKLKVGDVFLYGKRMIEQKENKNIGDIITFYRVLNIGDTGNVEYIPVYEKLED